MSKPFDIRDGSNVYEPCPICHTEIGMGITSRAGRIFVHCSCGHAGPAITMPDADTYVTTWRDLDRQAFETWNSAAASA